MTQHPILNAVPDLDYEDERAYELVALICEESLAGLTLSCECASTLRRCASAARRAGQLPPRELRPVRAVG